VVDATLQPQGMHAKRAVTAVSNSNPFVDSAGEMWMVPTHVEHNDDSLAASTSQQRQLS
jgi:hypothetical protein